MTPLKRAAGRVPQEVPSNPLRASRCASAPGGVAPGQPMLAPRRAFSPADERRTAWVTASRYEELDRWRALYEALVPPPAGWRPQEARTA